MDNLVGEFGANAGDDFCIGTSVGCLLIDGVGCRRAECGAGDLVFVVGAPVVADPQEADER